MGENTQSTPYVSKKPFLSSHVRESFRLCQESTPDHTALMSNCSSLLSQRHCVTPPRVVAAYCYPSNTSSKYPAKPNAGAAVASAWFGFPELSTQPLPWRSDCLQQESGVCAWF